MIYINILNCKSSTCIDECIVLLCKCDGVRACVTQYCSLILLIA